MTKDETLKLALKALETCGDDEWHSEDDYGMVQVYDEQQVSEAIAAIKEALAQPAQEVLYGMHQDDWKDVVAAITKVRDGRGMYLAYRPADVFQDWFLALGTTKVKEKNHD